MKLGVLVTGMFRELDTSIKSWKFKDEIECDFYFSTWNISKQKNSRLGFDLNEPVTDDMILKHFPEAKINILNQDDYDFSSDTFYHNAKQIFHWKNALRMLKESGKVYDSIMIIRTDDFIFYPFHSNQFFELNREDRIYGISPIYISGPKEYFLMDYFFIGNFKNMSKMIESLPNEMQDNIHKLLAIHSLSIGLIVEQVNDFSLSLVRPNTRGIEDLTMDILQNKFWEWGQNTGN